jgi:hypothetical protein
MDASTYLDRKGKMICALDPDEAARLIDDLMAAEISGEIDVVGPEESHRLKHPPEECGFSCQINRVFLGMGNDLEEFEWERTQLQRGQAIVAVPAASPAVQQKVREIMASHCNTKLHFHGKWTTEN